MTARIAIALCIASTACTISDATFTGTHSGPGSGGHGPDANTSSSLADLPCNTPVSLGSTSDISTLTGSRSLAAARTPSGLVVGYTTASGVSAVNVDLTTSPPTRSDEVHAAAITGGNLQLVSKGEQITITSIDSGGGMRVTVTDASLLPIASKLQPQLTLGAPDHSAPAIGDGVVIVGEQAGIEEIQVFDSVDVSSSKSYQLFEGTGYGGSIIRLDDTRYAAVWYDYVPGPTCALALIDASLTNLGGVQLTACSHGRVAASPDGSQIAISYNATANNPSSESIAIYAGGLTATPTITSLLSSAIAPPRSAAGRDAFWTIAPASLGILQIISTDYATHSPFSHTLDPFTSTDEAANITFDVIGDGQRVWAVWLSAYVSPILYVEQMCL